jgi:hypothetical protein
MYRPADIDCCFDDDSMKINQPIGRSRTQSMFDIVNMCDVVPPGEGAAASSSVVPPAPACDKKCPPII